MTDAKCETVTQQVQKALTGNEGKSAEHTVNLDFVLER